MIDIILEISCAGIAFLGVMYLWRITRHSNLCKQAGWSLIFSGCFFLLTGMLMDVAYAFSALNDFLPMDSIFYEVFIEKEVFELLGVVLIAYGVYRWVPAILHAERKNIDLSLSNLNLAGEVDLRTGELQQSNKLLLKEIDSRKGIEALLRQSEDRYRQVFDTNQAVKIIIDADDGRIVEANNAAVKFYGYDINTLKSMTISEINVLPEAQVREEMLSAKRNEKLYFNFRHQLASGEIRDVEVYTGPVQSNGQSLLYSIVHDITDRKRAEEALRRALKMEAVGQLTGGIAHDFNNILNIISGHISLLERNKDYDEKSLKRIAAIKIATQRAVDLTRQLLVFSRQEAISLKRVGIDQLVSEMDSLIIRSLTPEVEVEQVLDEGLWQTEIDPGDFKDALLNLTLNARDAMGGRGHLRIQASNCVLSEKYCKVHTEVKPGEYVCLTVSDTGHGINKEDMEHVFEPFFTTKDLGEGTGLGLSMVFGFVHRSGGSIQVSSEKNSGTTFKLYLPRAEVNEDNQSQMKNLDSAVMPTLPAGNESLLVVDDEKEILDIVRDMLQFHGYQIYTACDGVQALKVLHQHPDIDMLLSDVVMPGGINGYELAEQVMSDRPEIKILLSSGYTDKAVAENNQVASSFDLLKKPYNQHDLVVKVRSILDGA